MTEGYQKSRLSTMESNHEEQYDAEQYSDEYQQTSSPLSYNPAAERSQVAASNSFALEQAASLPVDTNRFQQSYIDTSGPATTQHHQSQVQDTELFIPLGGYGSDASEQGKA